MPEPVRLKADRALVIQLVDHIIAAFESKRQELTLNGQAITPIDQLMVAHNFHKAMVLGACKIASTDQQRLQTLHIASVTWVEMTMREMDKLTPKAPLLGEPDAGDSPISLR
jgi:hypothetical protein